MRIYADKLAAHLQAGLAPVYLVAGDEPLLVAESCAAVRDAAEAQGYGERQVVTVEPGFDWDSLFTLMHSPSLFSARRLIELRMSGASPGAAGVDMLEHIGTTPPVDTLLLVSAGRLDKRAQASRWVRALEAAGTLVLVYPLEAAQLPRWVASRLRSRGLAPEAGVVELLAYHFEGNLLALAQEVDKLAMLRAPGSVSVDDIGNNLGDNARFSVFDLADNCLRGEYAVVDRILMSLRTEGTEPILILRVLSREARMLAQISLQLAHGQSQTEVFGSLNVWPRRRALLAQALKRAKGGAWLEALRRAARTDRVLKGRLAGDVWQELQCLAATMCSARIPTCAEVSF